MSNVQTGTNLSQFDQAMSDLQSDLIKAPSYAPVMDRSSGLAKGLEDIGTGRRSFGDVAKDYVTRKLEEASQFSQKYEFNEGEQNFSEYAEGMLLDAVPGLFEAEEDFRQTHYNLKEGAEDWKNLIKSDVANALNIPDYMKENILAGNSLSTAGKDYIANKINESPIPINVSKERDGYKLSKEFDLGSNASLSVSENLRSGRDPNTRVAFDASTNLGGGRLSAKASKDSSRQARASLGYDWRNEDNSAGFSARFDKVEGRKPEFNLKFDKKFNKR